ncbi:MAG: hypothetical protein HC888_02655 [Candidatus Competibacteraceae bacterium]|nr:hypothetical protein [Candidatus Competibacteraceae bacterium]
MIQRAATRRLIALEDMRKTEKTEKEDAEIRKLLKFIESYKKYSEVSKLNSTFTGFPTGPDGRVHPKYKIHGTVTGRLSSVEPNIQNPPEEVLEIFKPVAGRVIVKADYSNIEYRVMAIITGETELEKKFNAGQNFHDINTRLLFGIEKEDAKWDVCRRAAKTFIFGLSYGGTVNGIYNKLLVAVPEMPMTLAQFTRLVDKYFQQLPKYKRWREETVKAALRTRCVETPTGRKRFLLGMPGDIEREALNTPIQGTAGEIAERALIKLDEWAIKYSKSTKLICTVHDSILAECDEADKMKVARAMKKIMEEPFALCGRDVVFPVDVEIGDSWGTTAKVAL